MCIDPLAEKYPYNSTYAFQENKMGMGIELEGLELAHKNPFTGVGNYVKGKFDSMTYSIQQNTSKAINSTQKWVKDNKKELLKTAEGMEKTGDAMVITGTAAALIGAPTVVGSVPGGGIVAAGAVENIIGKGMGIAVEAIAGDGDKAAQKTVDAVADKAVDVLIDTTVDALIPGPTPHVSGPFREALKSINEQAKQTAGALKTASGIKKDENQ